MRELAPDDPRHGTAGGYTNHRCRCDRCRRAQADATNDYNHRTGRRRPREIYLTEIRANPPAHGTESRYSHHRCRCDECKRASREARARRRAKVTA